MPKLVETLQLQVAETESTIRNLSAMERERILEINRISAGDVRGKTPEVSARVRQLDIERRHCVETRRGLMGELAAARSALEKAKSIAK